MAAIDRFDDVPVGWDDCTFQSGSASQSQSQQGVRLQQPSWSQQPHRPKTNHPNIHNIWTVMNEKGGRKGRRVRGKGRWSERRKEGGKEKGGSEE